MIHTHVLCLQYTNPRAECQREIPLVKGAFLCYNGRTKDERMFLLYALQMQEVPYLYGAGGKRAPRLRLVQKDQLSLLAFDPRFSPEALARAFEDEEEDEEPFQRDPWA